MARALGDVTTRRGRYLLVYLAIVVAMGLLFVRVPRSFLLDEDQGFLFIQVSAPPGTASEDFSEYAGAGVPSMMFNIGVYDQERIDAARNGGPPIPSNHSPQFAPVPKPTIETGITAMTLAVLSAFDQKSRRKLER